MTRRSRLATPGGWVHASALASGVEVDEIGCAFCGTFDELPWLHVAARRLVCRHCLRDPWADDGEAGRQTAERLVALLEQELVIY